MNDGPLALGARQGWCPPRSRPLAPSTQRPACLLPKRSSRSWWSHGKKAPARPLPLLAPPPRGSAETRPPLFRVAAELPLQFRQKQRIPSQALPGSTTAHGPSAPQSRLRYSPLVPHCRAHCRRAEMSPPAPHGGRSRWAIPCQGGCPADVRRRPASGARRTDGDRRYRPSPPYAAEPGSRAFRPRSPRHAAARPHGPANPRPTTRPAWRWLGRQSWT